MVDHDAQRVGGIKGEVSKLHSDVSVLATNVKALAQGQTDTNANIKQLTTAVNQGNASDWKTIFGGISVLLTIAGYIGYVSMKPVYVEFMYMQQTILDAKVQSVAGDAGLRKTLEWVISDYRERITSVDTDVQREMRLLDDATIGSMDKIERDIEAHKNSEGHVPLIKHTVENSTRLELLERHAKLRAQ